MNLKEMRISKGLSQKEAAALLGITRRTYLNYEHGKIDLSKPRYSYIPRLLEEYGKIDEEHGLLDVKTIQTICTPILKEYDVSFCILFGSYAKGSPTEKSDVDLFVSIKANGLQYYDLLERLRQALHKKVDLVHETQLINNLYLTKEILKDGVKIYG